MKLGVCVTQVNTDMKGSDFYDSGTNRQLLGASAVLYSLCLPKHSAYLEVGHVGRNKVLLVFGTATNLFALNKSN